MSGNCHGMFMPRLTLSLACCKILQAEQLCFVGFDFEMLNEEEEEGC